MRPIIPLSKQQALERILARASRSHLIISQAGVELIASFEGFSPIVYDDPAGNCTIGFGFLLHLGVCDDKDRQDWRDGITEAEGKAQLATKAQEYADCMSQATRAVLNPNQHAALTSFTYNVGCGGYINSSVRQAVESGGDVRDALLNYIHGTDGVAYPGLIRRRKAEADLYYTEDEDAMTPELKTTLDALYAAILDQGKRLGQLQKAVPALAVANADSFQKIEERLKALEP